MKCKAILRCGAVFSAALAVFAATSLSSFAEEESEAAAEVSGAAESEDAIRTCGDFTYTVLSESEDDDTKFAYVESYTGDASELVIPEKLDGLEVVGFGKYALADMPQIKKVSLPKTVTVIGLYTFAACSNITEYAVDPDNTVFSSRNGVLYADESTALVRWPIGRDETEVEIPEGVTMIGSAAFADSQKITSVKFPESLTRICASAFASCTGLTEITLPDTVTQIDEFAFNSCENLKSVKLPKYLVTIGSGAFAATALETVELPNMLDTVGEQAFTATPMDSVTIPGNVGEIGYSAFGWDVDKRGELYAKEGFTIRGYRDTGAYYYAIDEDNSNKFVFEELKEEEASAAAEESTAAETEDGADADSEADPAQSGGFSTGRIIGISACGVLLLGILTGAALSGRKKKTNEEKKDDA